MSDTSGRCLFLDLPLEIREQIYDYLLTTKSTKEYVLHKAPKLGRRNPREVDPSIQHRPGHVYRFQTAILRTNRQINKEAEHVFYGRNQFVSISHNCNVMKALNHLQEISKKEGIKKFFERRGFPVLAIDQTARDFKHYAMDVFFGQFPTAPTSASLEYWWTNGKRSENDWRQKNMFMIACDDLQQLCKFILEVHHCVYRRARFPSRDHTILLVDVINRGDRLRRCLKDGSIPVDIRVKRLLEPFRRLHSIGRVIIAGRMNEQYRSEIVASIMREPPTVEDLINTACATKAEGDEAFRNKDFYASISAYEKAYSDIEAGHQPSSRFALVAKGKYEGVLVSSAKEHLLFTLRLDIVAALLQLRECQHAQNWGRVELYTHKNVISDSEFARMWHLRSQASRGLGHYEVAYHELVQAVVTHPDNKDMAADLGNMTANVLKSSAVTLTWASSSGV